MELLPIKAKLSNETEAIFETVEDFLLYVAQLSNYQQFVRYHLQATGTRPNAKMYRALQQQRQRYLTMAKKVTCTDGSTLFDALRKIRGRV
jgi:hypothetical protein